MTAFVGYLSLLGGVFSAGRLRLDIPGGNLQAARLSMHNELLYMDMGSACGLYSDAAPVEQAFERTGPRVCVCWAPAGWLRFHIPGGSTRAPRHFQTFSCAACGTLGGAITGLVTSASPHTPRHQRGSSRLRASQERLSLRLEVSLQGTSFQGIRVRSMWHTRRCHHRPRR